MTLKKKTIQFPLSFNLYFQQKRAPKLPICHLPTKRSVWGFDVTNSTNGFSSFQSYHEVVMYLFSSLAKSCTLANISCFPRRLVFSVTLFVFQDVLKTYLRCVFLKRLQDVLQGVFKTFSRRLQDVFKTSSRRVCKTSCNYVFKTSSRRL